MLWIKILLCVAIVAFCTVLGHFAASKYRARKNLYSQWYHFNEQYLNELTYARKPLYVFLKEHQYSGDFQKIIDAFVARKTGTVTMTFLTKTEQAELNDYFSMLGNGDALAQSGYFGARRAALSEKKSVSEREAGTKGELYVKLGLLAGLAFVILIV